MSLNPIEFLASYIEKETGIIYNQANIYQLKSRLEDICKHHNIESIDELAKKFQAYFPDPFLKQKLLDIATNNETLFFRDPTFFTAIENYILREVLLEMPDEIKIWSAASSTGQEAISVAIALDELSKKVPLPPYSITATDICDKAISKARSGVYSDFEVMRGLSEERKANYFTKQTDGWKVNKNIQSKMTFGYNNLIKSTVTEQFHIILCRNVLIYQKVEMKRMVLDSLFKQLLPVGGILLGVGETMVGIKENVDTTMVGNVIFYRKDKNTLKGAA